MAESHNKVLIKKCIKIIRKSIKKNCLKSKILIIAGSDSGGAGIQADIKTITSLGSYAMTAITAVTAQNTTGVKSIIPIRPKEISNQISFTAKDIRPQCNKDRHVTLKTSNI